MKKTGLKQTLDNLYIDYRQEFLRSRKRFLEVCYLE